MDEYPQDLSEADKKLGFQIEQVDNSTAHLAFNPATVAALVYHIDQVNRIIKATTPIDDRIEYYHQKFGVARGLKKLVPKSLPKWNPTENRSSNPSALISLIGISIFRKRGTSAFR